MPAARHRPLLLSALFATFTLAGCHALTSAPSSSPAPAIPTLDQVVSSKQDLWSEAAIAQPDGPTYSFFSQLLPPLRYCDAPFHCYPIPLSTPGSPVKARLVSDGSAINALARTPKWVHETGSPVTFTLGPNREPFGRDLSHLTGPKLQDGHLPVVSFSYSLLDSTVSSEFFTPTDESAASHAPVFARFNLAKGKPIKLEAQLQPGYTPFRQKDNALYDADGHVVAQFDPAWTYIPGRATLTTTLLDGYPAYLAIYTKPLETTPPPLTPSLYDNAKTYTTLAWSDLLSQGTQIHVPEPLVNDAWRTCLLGQYTLLADDQMRYSAGNQYATIYIAEGSDAVRSLLLYGRADTAKRCILPLLKHTRKGLEFHQAGLKLQLLAQYYALTRDKSFLEETRPYWNKELNLILTGRDPSTGLFPRERYCGDVETPVLSLNSNANCWRALHDFARVLDSLGDHDRSQLLLTESARFRRAIIAAVDNATRTDVKPPFIPIALSGEEQPYDLIPDSGMGGYYNLMIPYVLGSGVFDADSPYATDIVSYLRNHGGLCAGLTRTCSRNTSYPVPGPVNINDLYGLRYFLTTLQRDDVDHALCTFYAKLALALTRDTFIGCEASALYPNDPFGREMSLPPNSASNANFLTQLRYLLVQDWEGEYSTLNLLFATPTQWLADGKEISITNAPTAFGPLSLRVTSHLAKKHLDATLTLPTPAVPHAFLRLRLPDHHMVLTATANNRPIPVSNNTLNLSSLTGQLHLRITTD